MVLRCWIAGFMLAYVPATSGVTLEQVISREHPTFDCADAPLAVGRDGLVYVGGKYVLRLRPDGAGKLGGATHYATHNVAANVAAKQVDPLGGIGLAQLVDDRCRNFT